MENKVQFFDFPFHRRGRDDLRCKNIIFEDKFKRKKGAETPQADQQQDEPNRSFLPYLFSVQAYCSEDMNHLTLLSYTKHTQNDIH